MGPAESSLQHALALLRGQPGDLAAFGAECVGKVAAIARVTDYYRANPHLMRPVRTTDAAPRTKSALEMDDAELTRKHSSIKTKDAWLEPPRHEGGSGDTPPVDPGDPATGIFGAQHARGRAGARLVQVLEGDVTSYYVAADGRGRACLYQVVSANGAGDPGKTTLTGDQRRRIIAGDAARSRAILSGINEANRRAWAGR